jgi:hypothetical protein
MELDIWRIFTSLGVPGVALGVLYMLFREFKWKFPSVPSAWVGPIVILFICVTGLLVYSALYFWAPINPAVTNPGSENSTTTTDIDIRGDWVADIVTNGETRHWRFKFDTFNNELYGSAHTWEPHSPGIQDGRIEGNYITFRTIWRNRWSSDPARIRDVWTTYRGEVSELSIDFIMQDDDGHAPFKFTATRREK